MTKIERDYTRLCRSEGFALLRIERRRGHCRLHFAAGFVIAGGTPSDVRNHFNVRSQIRRIHR